MTFIMISQQQQCGLFYFIFLFLSQFLIVNRLMMLILTLNTCEGRQKSHLWMIMTQNNECTVIIVFTLDHFTKQRLEEFVNFFHFHSIYDWIKERMIHYYL